jgi:transcriptional regulator with AAA-type ATPase domain
MRLQLLRDGIGVRTLGNFSTPPPANLAPTARDRNGHCADAWSRLLTRLAALQPFIVESPAMRDLIVAVEGAGEAAATTLITGETGVGKELIARAIPKEPEILRCR